VKLSLTPACSPFDRKTLYVCHAVPLRSSSVWWCSVFGFSWNKVVKRKQRFRGAKHENHGVTQTPFSDFSKLCIVCVTQKVSASNASHKGLPSRIAILTCARSFFNSLIPLEKRWENVTLNRRKWWVSYFTKCKRLMHPQSGIAESAMTASYFQWQGFVKSRFCSATAVRL